MQQNFPLETLQKLHCSFISIYSLAYDPRTIKSLTRNADIRFNDVACLEVYKAKFVGNSECVIQS